MPDDAFAAMDKDNDGSTDLEAFCEAARRFQPPLARQEAEHCFQQLNCNHDSKVSFTEFSKSLRFNRFREGFSSGCMPTLVEFKNRMSGGGYSKPDDAFAV